MKRHLKVIAAAILFAAPGLAFAQTDTQTPTDAAPSAQAPAMSPDMMQSMMQMMQNDMGMMQMMHGMQMMQMMRGMQMMQMMEGMMQGGMGSNMPAQGTMGGGMPMTQGSMSEAASGYMAAMSKMDMPMMQGIQASDPDVAFVQGMIPHHQGAIDMAKVELQYGDDEQAKAWANQIIAAQEKEIADMQEWLKTHGGQ